MRIVGPFAAARQLDPATGILASNPPSVTTWQALDRVTGMPAVVYLLPYPLALPALPDSPLLLPYTDKSKHGQVAYVACDLSPAAHPCNDVQLLVPMGLRALMALHEAGIIHGAVSPAQFWQDGNQLFLAGAGLPWSEAPEPYRAPEGGRSAAADLFAFGVTVLNLGHLPQELRALLSPYPAQRPSARDALALLNAGPRHATQRVSLVVDTPKSKLPDEVVSVVEPLPLVADPDFRAPDIDLQETVLVPDQSSRLERQRREQQLPPRVADLPPVLAPTEPPKAALSATETTASGLRVVRIQVPPQQVVTETAKPKKAELVTEPPKLLGLEDAMPVQSRVTVRPTGNARPVAERLSEVLKPVKPIPGEAPAPKPIAPEQLLTRSAKPNNVSEPQPSPQQPISAPGLAAKASTQPESTPVNLAPETTPPRPTQSVPIHPTTNRPVVSGGVPRIERIGLGVDLPPEEPLPAPAPTKITVALEPAQAKPTHISTEVSATELSAAAANWQTEWIEEWSADGLVYSSLSQPSDIDPDDVAALKGPAQEEDFTTQPQQAAAPAPQPPTPAQPKSPILPAGLVANESLRSRREFKPIKMAWNPDGSWYVKHDDEPAPEIAPPVRAAEAGKLAQTVRQSLSQGLKSIEQLLRAQKDTDTQADTQAAPPTPSAPSHNPVTSLFGSRPSPRQQALDRLKPRLINDRAATEAERSAISEGISESNSPLDTTATNHDHDMAVRVDDLRVAAVEQGQEDTLHSDSLHSDYLGLDAYTSPANPKGAAAPQSAQAPSQESGEHTSPELIVMSEETMPSQAESSDMATDGGIVTLAGRHHAAPVVPIDMSVLPTVRAMQEAQSTAQTRLLDNLEDADIRPVVRTQDTEAPEGTRWKWPKWSIPSFGTALSTETVPVPQTTPDTEPAAPRRSLPTWWWKVLLGLVLLLLVAWAVMLLLRRNATVGGQVTPPGAVPTMSTSASGCCSLQVQVYSPEGERLSVPVTITAEQVPTGSRLKPSTTLGSAPGVINVDAPGHYSLGLQAESYQKAVIDVDLPRKTPLNITLQ